MSMGRGWARGWGGGGGGCEHKVGYEHWAGVVSMGWGEVRTQPAPIHLQL